MITNLTQKRPYTATIHSVYQPIEKYRELLPVPDADESRPDRAKQLPPLDAFLIYLLLDLHPVQPTLVDLAAEATRGETTVLGLTHPRVRRVLAHWSGAAPCGTGHPIFPPFCCPEWQAPPDATLEPLPPQAKTDEVCRVLGDPGKRSGTVFLTFTAPGNEGQLAARVQGFLDAVPKAWVLILGLGRLGECAALETLVASSGSASGRRLCLLRELGEVLSSSRLGLVARRDNLSADEALRRIQQLYTTNFSFLELVKNASLAAMRAADIDGPTLKAHPAGWLVENREKTAALERALNEMRHESSLVRERLAANLDKVTTLERALHESRQEAVLLHQALRDQERVVADFRSSLSFKLARRASAWWHRLTPAGTLRFRMAQKFLQAIRIWRADGWWSLLRRAARKCLPF
jgi:hypothetical protein